MIKKKRLKIQQFMGPNLYKATMNCAMCNVLSYLLTDSWKAFEKLHKRNRNQTSDLFEANKLSSIMCADSVANCLNCPAVLQRRASMTSSQQTSVLKALYKPPDSRQ